MPTPRELEQQLWKKLDSDRTVMLGLVGEDDGHTRPMTAMIEGEHGPIWFFTARDTALARRLARGEARSCAAFAAKSHDVFATIHGSLRIDNDRAAIDRLWNPFIAAWYEGGKDDPKLTLLRMDPDRAEVWENENSLLAGIKLLFGVDPKKDYEEKVAKVDLR